MKDNRYVIWMAVWDWFGTTDTTQAVPKEVWIGLYELLNSLWLDERKDAMPEELAAHSGAMSKFKQEREEGFFSAFYVCVSYLDTLGRRADRNWSFSR